MAIQVPNGSAHRIPVKGGVDVLSYLAANDCEFVAVKEGIQLSPAEATGLVCLGDGDFLSRITEA